MPSLVSGKIIGLSVTELISIFDKLDTQNSEEKISHLLGIFLSDTFTNKLKGYILDEVRC